MSGRTWLIVAVAAGAAILYLSSRSSAAAQPDVVPTSGNDATGQQASGGGAAPAGGGGADTAALLAALGQQNSDLVAQLLTTSHAFGTTSSAGFTSGATGGFPDTTAPDSAPTPTPTASTTTSTTDAGPVTTTGAAAALGLQPGDNPVGTVTTDVQPFGDAGPTYTGFTQQPVSVSSTGDPVLGIIPGVNYRVGSGGSVDPLVESSFQSHYSTPAIAINAVGERNAVNYATKTGQAVAA